MNDLRSYHIFCGNLPTTVFPIAILATLGIFSAGIGINYLRGKYDKPYYD